MHEDMGDKQKVKQSHKVSERFNNLNTSYPKSALLIYTIRYVQIRLSICGKNRKNS